MTVLSLDLARAFPNTSHERLLHIMHEKGIPRWITRFVESFISDRTTKIVFPGFKSERTRTRTGIPQGSTLSPILFLIFISDLLEEFSTPKDGIIGFGFVDDTNLAAWGTTARDNCTRLERAHNKCKAWADRHGAAFEPKKYQIMHFTKKRGRSEDLESTVRIENQPIKVQKTEMRMLGIWFDPKLTWKPHAKRAAEKGAAAFAAMGRIVGSIWGLDLTKARLIYTATVRPTMLYGVSVWGSTGKADKGIQITRLKEIRKVQNNCLRKIMGGYRRTPVAALEREAGVQPVDIYAEEMILRRTQAVRNHDVEKRIGETLDKMWNHMAAPPRPRGRPGTNRREIAEREGRQKTNPRPRTDVEKNGEKLKRRNEEALRLGPRPGQTETEDGETGGYNHRWKETTAISKVMDNMWRTRWETAAEKNQGTTWRNPWPTQTVLLYAGLRKEEATMLFLLRTEVIGLKAWLAATRVPGISPTCECGWRQQTVRHMLYFCRRFSREDLLLESGEISMTEMLSNPEGGRTAAKWCLRNSIMKYMDGVYAASKEGKDHFRPAPRLE
jgi:hypothetical protein